MTYTSHNKKRRGSGGKLVLLLLLLIVGAVAVMATQDVTPTTRTITKTITPPAVE